MTATNCPSVAPEQETHDFDSIDLVTSRAHGLALCLEELAREFPGLCNPSPMARGITALIQAVRGEIEHLQAVIDTVRYNK